MAVDIDREQLIFTITLTMIYAESYLETLKDEELLDLYSRVIER